MCLFSQYRWKKESPSYVIVSDSWNSNSFLYKEQGSIQIIFLVQVAMQACIQKITSLKH